MASDAADRAAGSPQREGGDIAPPARCRNCGAAAPGAFCPACGQETTLALPTARQFLKEAAGRYVALDGRSWRTLAALLSRPGFLTREYFAGRRRRYIRPARLFLVASVLLFAVLRFVVDVPAFTGGEGLVTIDDAKPEAGAAPAVSAPESAAPAAGAKGAPAGVLVAMPGLTLRLDDAGNLTSDAADGPLAAELKRRLERFNALPREHKAEQLVLGTLRYGPYAMFGLLPAFALLLMLAYAGSRSRYPRRPRRYAEHLVFAAHNHAFLAILIAATALIAHGAASAVAAAWGLVYMLWSMKSVYEGRWVGVIARASLIAVAYLVLFAIATAGLVLAAVVIG